MNEATTAAALTALSAIIVQIAALWIDRGRKEITMVRETLVDVKAERDRLRAELDALEAKYAADHDALILARAREGKDNDGE